MTDLYTSSFFDDNIRVGLSAAEIVMPWVVGLIQPATVIDVGCGPGAWLSVAKRSGCEVFGVDGFAPDDHLLIEQTEFHRQDLERGVSCIGYDLAMTLEVAEHLPASSAPALVDGLCEAPFVFWSAAVPGQLGVNHINEQWPSWWEPYFNANGYVGSCDIRRVFWNDTRIATFYRQNFIIWSTPERLEYIGLSQGVIDEIHPEHKHIPPPSWHI